MAIYLHCAKDGNLRRRSQMVISICWETRNGEFDGSSLLARISGDNGDGIVHGYSFTALDVCMDANTGKVVETSIECKVLNWYSHSVYFVRDFVPYLETTFGIRAKIKIDGLSLEVWSSELEKAYIGLRRDALFVVSNLKSTRRFFRNRLLENLRKHLEWRLEEIYSKITSVE